MPRKKKERLPCEECGRITPRNTTYKDLDNANLCEGCRNMYRNNPIKYKPPIGEVHFDENDKIICHICGRGGFDKLSTHLIQRHKMTGLEYKAKFGLNKTQSLTSKSFREDCKERSKGNRERLLPILDKHRPTTQFTKGEPINKGRVLSAQARKNLANKKKNNTAISVTAMFAQRRKEAKRQKELQERENNIKTINQD